MPRKFIRRWLPEPSKTDDGKRQGWLSSILDDPNLLHLNRHSVSGAVFIGLFCAFLPLPGQVILASLLALRLRCNLPISVLLIWVSNPITIPPMMVLLYKFGQFILGNEATATAFKFSWTWFTENGATVYLPVAVGGVLAGLIIGGLGYLTVQLLWRWVVLSNWQARKKKRLEQNN